MAELVNILDAIPVVLPVIHSEAFVIFEGVDEEIAISNGIENREPSSMSHSIRVRRKLSAFHKNASNGRVCFKCLIN